MPQSSPITLIWCTFYSSKGWRTLQGPVKTQWKLLLRELRPLPVTPRHCFFHRSTSLQTSSTRSLKETLTLIKVTSLLLLTSAFGSLTNWMFVSQTKNCCLAQKLSAWLQMCDWQPRPGSRPGTTSSFQSTRPLHADRMEKLQLPTKIVSSSLSSSFGPVLSRLTFRQENKLSLNH